MGPPGLPKVSKILFDLSWIFFRSVPTGINWFGKPPHCQPWNGLICVWFKNLCSLVSQLKPTWVTCFPNTHLHFYPKYTGLPCYTEDVVIAQPEVSTDGSKSTFVLLPVTAEWCEANLASLDNCPATTICLHITEDLKAFSESVSL